MDNALDIATKKHRAKAIELAIDDGFLVNTKDARNYDLDVQGKFFLKANPKFNFKVESTLWDFYNYS